MIGYYWNKVIKKAKWKAIKNSKIDKTSKVEAGSQVINTTMNKYSFCGYDCKILNCEIGKFTSIADGVIIGGAQHPISWVSSSPVFYKGRDSVKKKFVEFLREPEKITSVGNDVWIGDRAIIKGGVTIGDGAVIGMGAVVTKDVGCYEVWGGCPAKKIRDRFPKEIINKLLKSQWWNMSDNELEKYAKLFQKPEEFIKELERE